MSHLFRLVLLLFLLQLRLVVENSTFAQIPTENLKLWLKANNVELVNEMVSQWYDASGNNLHLTQSNEANRPLQTSNIYAGYPAIRFDGINDQLKVNFSELTNQPVTFFVVWKKNASKQQNIFDGVDESNRMTFGQSYSNLENFAINASGTGLGLYYTKPVTSNLTVSSIIFSSPSKFFDNGVLKKSGNAGTMGINGLTVGAAYNNSRFFNGDITEIIVYNAELTDAQRQQVEQYLMDKYAPPVSFGEDITVNYGFCSQTLSIANGFTNIQWSNGDTTQTIEVSKTGEYWVSATDIFGRTTSDTINVTFTTGNPKVFSQNTTLCPDSLYIFHTGEFNSLNHYTVKWFNDFEGDTLQISNHEGEVWATITDSSLCTMQTDTISIVIDLFNQIFTLGNDTTFCSGNSISLLDNPLFDQINEFVWSNGSTNSSIVITATGNYWVEVKNNNGCLSRDTIYVTVSGVAPTVDFDFSGVCKNTPVNFTNNSTADPLDPITDVLWDFNDGDSSILHNPQHIFQNAGTYNIRLYVYSQSGCNNNIIKPITIHDLPKAFFQVDTACVANQYFFFDSSTPQPETTIETWHWDFGNGETSTEINPTEIFSQIAQHNLSLTVTDNFGCQGTYDTTITVVGQMADPNPFTLIWPPNNYASEQNTFAFSWNKSQGAQLYSFEISTDISFQDTVYQSLLTDSKIDYTLSDGSYYWRILARNYCGDEISSNIHFIQSGFISSQNGLSAAFSSSKQVEHDEENLVSSWGDITGAGFTATQTDNKAKPKLEANILNGKPALRFAHNDSASFLSFNNINLSNHDYTIFTVIKPENFNLPVHYFVSGGTTTESGLFAGGELIKGIGSFDGVNSMQTNTNSSQWQIAVFQNDKIIINGTEAQYGAYSIMSGLQLNTLGTRSSAIETQYFNGYLADLIVFNRKLTTDEIISVQDYLRFQYFPPVNLGSDTALACGSCNYTLSVPDYYSTYQWSNGATTPTIDINQTGNYWVKVTDIFGFTSTDTIFIKCPTKSCYPPVDLGSDIDIACGICEAEISAFAPHFVSYIWSNGQTSSTITATETGYYYVTATDTDGYLSVDSVFIQCPSVSCDPPVDLGPDINIDYGFCPVTLNAGDVYIDYKWSTGDTTQTIAVSQTGYYHVTVTDQYNYISTDSVKVTFPAIMLSDTAICVGETITLNTGLGGDYQYFWSNTSMSETITVSQQQEVWVLVTDSSGCEHTSPTVTIMVDSTSLTPVFTDDSVSLCSGNSIVANLPDTWNYQYSWCTGAQTHFIDVLNSGKYYVTVTSSNQCSVTDSIDVNVVGIAPVVDIAAENICHNDTLLITNNSYSPDSSAITLNWRLSDGQSFSGDNPEFIPTTAGTNTLILELESESGCQNTDSINFEVYPLPDFEIWSPDIVCNGQVVQFEAVTGQTNIAEWLWDFGNGVTDSTQNPQHIYDSPGTYQIIVNAVTEFGCSNTETKDITVHPSNIVDAQIELLSPANEETIKSKAVTFSWRPTETDVFEYYKVEVSQNPDFSTILYSADTESNTHNGILITVGVHYWRITGYTLCSDSAISETQSFTIYTPGVIPNLLLWLKADNVVLENEFVSQWNDASSNNLHLSQPNETNRPIQTANIYAGYPAICFDGINDQLKVNFSELTNQPVTFFVVWKKSVSKQQNIFDGIDESNRMTFGQPYNSSESIEINARTGYLGLSYTKPETSNLTVSSIIFSSPSKLFDNGILKVSGNAGTMGINGLTVGAAYNNSRFFNGDIAEIIIYNAELTDSQRQEVEQFLMDKYAPPVYLGEDINVEYGFCPTTLQIGTGFTDIEWSTGENSEQITVNQSGEYWVKATDIFGRVTSDTINVTYTANNPKVLSQNTNLCPDSLYMFHVGEFNSLNYYNVKWFNGFEGDTLWLSNYEGDVWATITDSSLYTRQTDTISIIIDPFNQIFTLGNDTTFCSGNSISIVDNPLFNQIDEFVWSNGSTNSSIVITESGNYWVEVKNSNGCWSRDTIYVTIQGIAPVIDITAENICLNETLQITNNSYSPDSSAITILNWSLSDGQYFSGDNPEFIPTTTGTNTLILELESESGCQNTDSINFEVYPLPDFEIWSPDVVCNGQTAQFEAVTSQTNITEWLWDFGDGGVDSIQNPQHTYNSPGTYQIIVTAVTELGCSNTETIYIAVHPSNIVDAQIELLSPANEETIKSQSVTFSWRTTGTDVFRYYKVEVSQSPDFSTILYSADTENNTHNGRLTTVGVHYWHIIGYTLCNDSTVSATQSFTIYTPGVIPNLLLWLKADDIVTENESVAQWNDASGNNLHLSQPDEANRPLQTSNIYAGYPAICFDGTNDYLRVSFPELTNQPTTFFVVWKKSASKQQNIFDGIDELNRIMFWQYASNLENFAVNASGSGLGLYYTKPVTSNLTVSSIILSSPSKLFDNGILKISGNAGSMGINGLTVGAAYNNSRFFNGDIAEIIVYNAELSDTQRQEIEQYLMNKYAPPVYLGEDINVGYGFCPITLQIDAGYTDIEWSTGDSTEQITVNQSGMYWVKATDFFGRTTSDTINVNFFEPLLPTDIAFCYGSEETVEVNLTGDYSILWSTNETTNSISISEPGTYWVRVTDTLGCFIQKEFNAHADMFSATATLGDDKALCNGNLIVLESGANEAITYLWSDGSSFPWFVVDNHTQVSVTVTNVNGCIAYDTVQINILGDTPNIAFDHTPICKGNSFVFNNLSQTIDGSSIDTCYWIFNQTDTIVGNEATYNSLETGYLPIYLYVTTTAGCYKDTSFYATVNHIPNVSFVPTSACEREDVLFQSTSTVDDGEITEWHWNVNGTQYHTSGFKHSFANAGNYSISLITTSDKGCTDSIVSTFNVKNSPTADFTYEKGCDGEPVAFLNQSTGWLGTSLDYIWHFDSQSQSTQVNPEHLFNGTGNFPVKLIATQQVNHCRDTIVKTVSVSEKPTSLPNDVEVCAKEIVTLTDNSLPGEDENIISKVWKISQPVGNIEESVLYTFDTSGVFSLTLTVENSAGCTDMKQSQLTIYETPKAIISTSLDTVYIPTTATLFAEDSSISHTYRWYIDNILLSNNASISYQINSEGTYDFGLAVETNKGCCDSTNKVLTALIPSVDLEIKSLSAVISDGKILIRPVFRNNGTTPLSQFVINVRFDNGTTFSEIFESTIYSGNEFGYTLRTRMDTPENGTPVYVCLDVVTIQLDQNPDNNYKCFVFDDNTRIFPPSPNPAKDEIKFTVISDNESSCEISIISSGGMLLWEDTLSIVPGVNDITIPTPASAVGINYMKVKINSTQKVFKIMVKQ